MDKETHCKKCGTPLVPCCSVEGCDREVEVYSRVVGYFRPVSRWNAGKKEEWRERKNYANIEDVHKRTFKKGLNNSEIDRTNERTARVNKEIRRELTVEEIRVRALHLGE